MRGPIMLSIQQCTVKSFRRLFSLPNHVTAANKRWSSTNEISEEFVRNVLLDENNKMEVVRRLEKLKMFKKPDRPLQKAAVLIPLCVCGGDLSILYTRRTPHMKANAGQPRSVKDVCVCNSWSRTEILTRLHLLLISHRVSLTISQKYNYQSLKYSNIEFNFIFIFYFVIVIIIT